MYHTFGLSPKIKGDICLKSVSILECLLIEVEAGRRVLDKTLERATAHQTLPGKHPAGTEINFM